MFYIDKLLQNDILICSFLAWIIAQIIKFIIHYIGNKQFDMERLLGSGGMPSSHSATFTALTLTCGYYHGFDSTPFAIATLLALVVIYDACGVRRAAGQHAEALNDLHELFKENISAEKQFKILIGHTPFQVLMGIILGIIITAIYCGI